MVDSLRSPPNGGVTFPVHKLLHLLMQHPLIIANTMAIVPSRAVVLVCFIYSTIDDVSHNYSYTTWSLYLGSTIACRLLNNVVCAERNVIQLQFSSFETSPRAISFLSPPTLLDSCSLRDSKNGETSQQLAAGCVQQTYCNILVGPQIIRRTGMQWNHHERGEEPMKG